MKAIAILITLPLLIIITMSSCNIEDERARALPPETQIGADTFGCLINGKVFRPYKHPFNIDGGSDRSCAYQYMDERFNQQGYYFQLSADRWEKGGRITGIGLYTHNLEIEEGGIYQLGEQWIDGNAYGNYDDLSRDLGHHYYYTDNEIHTGELWIKKFDVQQGIIAGTFWFDAVSEDGEKVEVREGRFDMRCTY